MRRHYMPLAVSGVLLCLSGKPEFYGISFWADACVWVIFH